jgi:hypothetical protein
MTASPLMAGPRLSRLVIPGCFYLSNTRGQDNAGDAKYCLFLSVYYTKTIQYPRIDKLRTGMPLYSAPLAVVFSCVTQINSP